MPSHSAGSVMEEPRGVKTSSLSPGLQLLLLTVVFFNIFPTLQWFPLFLALNNCHLLNKEPNGTKWVIVISFRVVRESMSTPNVLRGLWWDKSFFGDASHHSIWTLLAVGRRDLYTDMVLSDSMGFSFPSRWCSVGWSYDRGTMMTQWTELDVSVCACVCMHARLWALNDGGVFHGGWQ